MNQTLAGWWPPPSSVTQTDRPFQEPLSVFSRNPTSMLCVPKLLMYVLHSTLLLLSSAHLPPAMKQAFCLLAVGYTAEPE